MDAVGGSLEVQCWFLAEGLLQQGTALGLMGRKCRDAVHLFR